VAVLALYRVPQDAFTRKDLCVLQTLASKLGLAVENAPQRSRGDTVSASGVAASAAHAGGD
jgi:GAF domain-containing protein